MAVLDSSVDLGTNINCATFLAMIAMVLAVILHPGIHALKEKTLRLSDAFIVIAMVFGVGRAIAVSRAVGAGLGQHIHTLSSQQMVDIDKAIYASQFLYVFEFAAIRFVTPTFVAGMSHNKSHRLISASVAVANALWLVVGIFGVAFQCVHAEAGIWSLNSERCFDQLAFWSFLEGFAMLVTLVTLFNILYIIWNLQMQTQKKVNVILIFSSKLIELPIDILRVVYLAQYYNRTTDTDPSYDSFAVVVTTEVYACVAVILAALPFLVRYIRRLSGDYVLEEAVKTSFVSMPNDSHSQTRSLPVGIVETETEMVKDQDIGLVPYTR